MVAVCCGLLSIVHIWLALPFGVYFALRDGHVGILGSGLVGAPLAGTLADTVGVPDTFFIVAAICASTAATTAWAWLKSENRESRLDRLSDPTMPEFLTDPGAAAPRHSVSAIGTN